MLVIRLKIKAVGKGNSGVEVYFGDDVDKVTRGLNLLRKAGKSGNC